MAMAVDRECSSSTVEVEGRRVCPEMEGIPEGVTTAGIGRRHLDFQRMQSRFRRVSSMEVAAAKEDRVSRQGIRTTMIAIKEWRSTCYRRGRRGRMIAAEAIKRLLAARCWAPGFRRKHPR